MRSSKIFWVLLALFLVLDGLFILLILWSRQDREPVLGTAPAFSLIDQHGEPFNSDELEGSIYVADFFFTTCAGPCPVMNANLAALQQQFAGNEEIRFVSITVDPETDTPERLREYGENLGADFSRWHFLTGPLERIHELAVAGFKIGSVEEPVIHSTRLILVDEEGQIRGYFSGIVDEDVAALEDALKSMVGGPLG